MIFMNCRVFNIELVDKATCRYQWKRKLQSIFSVNVGMVRSVFLTFGESHPPVNTYKHCPQQSSLAYVEGQYWTGALVPGLDEEPHQIFSSRVGRGHQVLLLLTERVGLGNPMHSILVFCKTPIRSLIRRALRPTIRPRIFLLIAIGCQCVFVSCY